MKFDKKYNPTLVCSDDESRKSIQNPYLVEKDGQRFIVATDGHSYVSIPVESSPIEPTGNITRRCVDDARKVARKNEKVNVSVFLTPDGMPTNSVMAVVPHAEGSLRIGLNAKKLLTLAKALGAEHEQVEIFISQDRLAPLMVRALEENNTRSKQGTDFDRTKAFGLLMPCRVDGQMGDSDSDEAQRMRASIQRLQSENEALKARIARFDESPDEGATRFSLLEVN